jgi:phage FluMu protein Com
MKPKPLKAVATLKNRSAIRQDFDGPVFFGKRGLDYTCPHCGNLLAKSLPAGVVYDIVIECGQCKKLSEFPTRPPNAAVGAGWVFFPVGIYRITSSLNPSTARAFGVDRNGNPKSAKNTKPGPLLS